MIEDALEQYCIAERMSPDILAQRSEKQGVSRSMAAGRMRIVILAELERLRSREYVDACYIALLHEALGDRDAAFEEFARAERENSATLYMLEVDSRLDSLREDARLSRLSERLFGMKSGTALSL